MATMKTLNGYGFNATEFNGKAASDYLQKTDTATNSAKLGGKSPEYYLQPHNLFDNSNFVDPVMQAEFNGMHGNEQYVIDRWVHLYNLGSSEKVYGGIAMTGADFYMAQKVGEDVSGKTLTFAVCLADGTVVCGTENVGDLSSTIAFAQHENLYLMLYNGYFSIRTETGTYTIQWAALYEGSYTVDTLPPYVPKGYAAELAECMRYYQIIPFDFSWSGLATNAGYPSRFPVVFPQTMHNTPTVMADNHWSSNMDANIQFDRISDRGCAVCITANNANYSEWHGRVICSSEL